MNDSTSSSSIFPSLLLLTFVILKLTHVIDWSWWWVLSPLWISVSIGLIIVIIFFILKKKELDKRMKQMQDERTRTKKD
jgi:uncharacterized membrane protein